MPSIARIPLAAALTLLLAACSEEEPVVGQAETQQQDAPAVQEDRTAQGLSKLREGADSLIEGGRQLSEEAIDRANRALEDADPTLRRAGEALSDAVQNAAGFLEQGVRDLERRIDEAETRNEEVASAPDAVLSPADQLNADTRAAARAVSAGVGPEYVGVWADEAATCQKIDQEPVEMFAVITPTTIRRYESVCNIEGAPLSDGTADIAASCIEEGQTENQTITFSMPSPGLLQIGVSPTAAELVRCHLPEQG